MHIHNFYTLLMCWPLYHYIMTFFVSCYLYWIEFYSVWYKHGYVCLFLFLFGWNIILHPFTLNLVFCRQHAIESCFLSIWPLRDFWLMSLVTLHLGWLLICNGFLLFCHLSSSYFVSLLFLFPSVSVYFWWFSIVIFSVSLLFLMCHTSALDICFGFSWSFYKASCR